MRFRTWISVGAGAMVLTIAGTGVQGQTLPSPTVPAVPAAPQEHRYGAGNLAERPRSLFMPEPSFPVTKRHDTQFTVEYVYRFAESDYAPAVEIRDVPKEKASVDTPEHAFASLISASRSLDYEWWLSLWDVKSKALFEQDAVQKKQDANFWRERWRAGMQGKTIVLAKRLELVNDVILEYSVGSGSEQSQALQPVVFKLVDGKWMVTQELADSTVLFLIGQGQAAVKGNIDFYPIPRYSDKPAPLEAAQKLFFEQQPRGLDTATQIVW